MRMRMKSVFPKTLSFLLCITLFLTIHLEVEAQQCSPSSQLGGTAPPPGECNTENDSQCCVEGEMYDVYECSPPVTGQTSARLTLNSFESGGDGGGESSCDGQFHSNNELIVALSTGWFDNRSRCNKNIVINGNGRIVTATVVDECDSTRGCDADHAYQPPCGQNIVDASEAVWTALEVSSDNWGGLDITWSDA